MKILVFFILYMLSLGTVYSAERNWVRIKSSNSDPVHIDLSSIKNDNEKYTFTYVLDVPILKAKRWEKRQWKSNQISVRIDCAKETYSIFKIVGFSGPKSSGERRGGYAPTRSEQEPKRIVKRSTMDYLAKYVCKSL